MQCPDLTQLPPPPSGKTGWPWTEQTPAVPKTRPDGSAWPRISVITPSFNQGIYIEETIRAVLLQGYPDIEYIIIDGGSSDKTVEVIEKYARWIKHWESKKDKGQPNAINKGLAHCTGTYFNFINSDDYFAPGTLVLAAEKMETCDMLIGKCINFGDDGTREVWEALGEISFQAILRQPGKAFHQPASWLRLEHLRKAGGYDEQFQYCFDWELIIRYLAMYPRVCRCDDVLAYFRLHPNSKTVSQQSGFRRDMVFVLLKLLQQAELPQIHGPCDHALRRSVFYSHLCRLEESASESKVGRAWKAIALSFSDPIVRFAPRGGLIGFLRRLSKAKA
jgi:hypothetical protein